MAFNMLNSLQWEDNKCITVVIFLIHMLMKGAETATSQAEIQRHLDLGRDFLASGQLSDALSQYHAAVEGDPNNYLTYFKRGTVYFALGKPRFALADFTRVLELKPDFTSARLQRGTVYMKLGDYDSAEKDFFDVMNEDPNNMDVRYSHDRIQPVKEQYQQIYEVIGHNDYRTAITLITQLLELSPWSTKLRELRAQCYINEDDIISAVSDLRSVNRLSQDSTSGYFKLSKLLYQLGEATDALKEIRECLKLDPEHSDCFPFYKKLRKVEKGLVDAQEYLNIKEYKECIESANKVLKFESDILMIIFGAKQLLCTCYVKDEQYAVAIGKCREALELKKEPSVYCDRAEAYIETEMYEDAVRDYQAALEIDEHLQRAKDGVERARRLQKQSERRDYYKILGVKKTATKQEIVKAYRKAAQKWHPDAYQGDEKKIAEKKFIDIAAAKEVLTDPEKRRQFDNGEDPLDPETNQGFRGGNPFHHFQQGGSPFQFKFHFN